MSNSRVHDIIKIDDHVRAIVPHLGEDVQKDLSRGTSAEQLGALVGATASMAFDRDTSLLDVIANCALMTSSLFRSLDVQDLSLIGDVLPSAVMQVAQEVIGDDMDREDQDYLNTHISMTLKSFTSPIYKEAFKDD